MSNNQKLALVISIFTLVACSESDAQATPQAPVAKSMRNEIMLPAAGAREVLEKHFKIMKVHASESFAHDYGMMGSIDKVVVDGKEIKDHSKVLSSLVAAWGGWNDKGARDDAAVKETALAFVTLWDALRLERAATDEEMKKQRQSPPSARIVDFKGERVVVVERFISGRISQRGKWWHVRKNAFRVKDGTWVSDSRFAGRSWAE